jgi:hypothetical protein
MRDLAILFVHLIVTLVRLARPAPESAFPEVFRVDTASSAWLVWW